MIAYLQGISQQRSSWKLLLVSALFLELSAMVFQHGLGLSPCVMCIYERITTMGLIAVGLRPRVRRCCKTATNRLST
ncbi:disulfide bond formation protein B [Brenneria uluponensis]|uniref:disulfide bond formation protein B n=1 Tax=Brenneria uluponensis TaxID=3057057 RepID=UPI0028E7E7B5|nr:disulfide bond formation protein B [Brenneria ulupoensis]